MPFRKKGFINKKALIIIIGILLVVIGIILKGHMEGWEFFSVVGGGAIMLGAMQAGTAKNFTKYAITNCTDLLNKKDRNLCYAMDKVLTNFEYIPSYRSVSWGLRNVTTGELVYAQDSQVDNQIEKARIRVIKEAECAKDKFRDHFAPLARGDRQSSLYMMTILSPWFLHRIVGLHHELLIHKIGAVRCSEAVSISLVRIAYELYPKCVNMQKQAYCTEGTIDEHEVLMLSNENIPIGKEMSTYTEEESKRIFVFDAFGGFFGRVSDIPESHPLKKQSVLLSRHSLGEKWLDDARCPTERELKAIGSHRGSGDFSYSVIKKEEKDLFAFYENAMQDWDEAAMPVNYRC